MRPLLPQKAPADMDTDVADVCAADKLMRRIKARYPAGKTPLYFESTSV